MGRPEYRPLACQPSAEAGAGPVAERARADEFDAVGGACGEASELAFTRFSLQRLSRFFASYSLWALYILENILEY